MQQLSEGSLPLEHQERKRKEWHHRIVPLVFLLQCLQRTYLLHFLKLTLLNLHVPTSDLAKVCSFCVQGLRLFIYIALENMPDKVHQNLSWRLQFKSCLHDVVLGKALLITCWKGCS